MEQKQKEQKPNHGIETIDFETLPPSNECREFFNKKLKSYDINGGFILINIPSVISKREVEHHITGAFLLLGLEDKMYSKPTNDEENLSYLCIRTK